jgi:hypothetical protein
MDEFFDKPIIEQMFSSRREDYEQSFFENDKEIKDIDTDIVAKENDINDFFKLFVKDEEKIKKLNLLIMKYEMAMSDERDYWCLKYYKQGMIDMYKLLKEIGAISTTQNINDDNPTKKDNDFIDKLYNNVKKESK